MCIDKSHFSVATLLAGYTCYTTIPPKKRGGGGESGASLPHTKHVETSKNKTCADNEQISMRLFIYPHPILSCRNCIIK